MEDSVETRYHEGCGRQGPIRCMFLSEFHHIAGPKIACQFPEDYVSKEIFDAISVYIIPKPQVQRSVITINALGHKVIGYPIRIDSSRYERNAYMFNLCFVCDSWSKTVQYEPVVKKLGDHLTIMEEEVRFVSAGSSKLPTMLAHLLHDLNAYRRATIVGDTVMHLKVLEVRGDPAEVHDHDVPALVADVGLPRPGRPPPTDPPDAAQPPQEHLDTEDEEPFFVDISGNWDLTTKQILPYINGLNHITKIASDSDVEKTLVKSCIQNLLYYGVVMIIPVLKFSNMYRAMPSLNRLFHEKELQQSCLAYITPKIASCLPVSDISKQQTLSAALELLCALQQGTSLKVVCDRMPAERVDLFDVRRLIVFATMHGLIRCLKKYPVVMSGASRAVWGGEARCGGRMPGRGASRSSSRGALLGLHRYFTGLHCVDEVCCLARLNLPLLEHLIEEDPDVAILWR